MAKTSFKPFFDDQGNRSFGVKRRMNAKENVPVFDVYVQGKDVRRDGKWMANLFIFGLTEQERLDMIKALQEFKDEVKNEQKN